MGRAWRGWELFGGLPNTTGMRTQVRRKETDLAVHVRVIGIIEVTPELQTSETTYVPHEDASLEATLLRLAAWQAGSDAESDTPCAVQVTADLTALTCELELEYQQLVEWNEPLVHAVV